MTIEFIEDGPYTKTISAIVTTDDGQTHKFRFGKDVSRSRMIALITMELPKSRKRTPRKAAE